MAQRDLNAGNRWTAAKISGAFPAGEVAWTKRGTTATTSGGTELPLLRLDNVIFAAGRSYMIIVSGLRIDMVTATEHFKFNLRLNTAGTATIASTPVLTRSEATADLDTMSPIIAFRRPSSAETGSLLLSIIRTAGASNATVQADDDNDIQFSVQDLGLAVADTGVVL